MTDDGRRESDVGKVEAWFRSTFAAVAMVGLAISLAAYMLVALIHDWITGQQSEED